MTEPHPTFTTFSLIYRNTSSTLLGHCLNSEILLLQTLDDSRKLRQELLECCTGTVPGKLQNKPTYNHQISSIFSTRMIIDVLVQQEGSIRRVPCRSTRKVRSRSCHLDNCSVLKSVECRRAYGWLRRQIKANSAPSIEILMALCVLSVRLAKS